MNTDLIHWYKTKHVGYQHNNEPNEKSLYFLKQISDKILTPLEKKLGPAAITYGFTSAPLLHYIQKNSPGDMAPKIDQHAAMELNSRGNHICKREGAACDFLIQGYENNMAEVARFIVKNLDFDRLYFYGHNKPIHISFSDHNIRYVLFRKTRSDGLRVNSKSTKGSATQTFFDNL